MLNVVPESAPSRITITGQLVHQCPHVNETDNGTVTISWTCNGETLELHGLAQYLASFRGVPVTHETITEQIRGDLAAIDGIEDVTVSTTWTTAQLAVRVEAMP